jgi:hypothetical protein
MLKILNLIKSNWKILIGLMLFIAVVLWKYGYENAPRAVFAIAFFYILAVYTLMVIPFAIGSIGFRKLKSHLMIAALLPIIIAIFYQLLFNDNILRIWYQGAFNREYIFGLMQAAIIIPAVSFIIGLMLRKR